MGFDLMKTRRNGTPLFVFLVSLILTNFYGQDILIAPVEADGKEVHIVYMGKRQHSDPELVTALHHDLLTSVVGSKEATRSSIIYSYRHGFSGFAARLTKSQAQQIAGSEGVLHVVPNRFYTLQTTRSWDYLGLSSHSPTNLLHEANLGDGVIIGIIDTGVWPESKAFTDEDLGPIPSRWKGQCDSGQAFNATTDCNKKIIGARWFIDGFLASNKQPLNTSENQDYLSPRDSSGHGTHTSSTAAGSFVGNVSYKGIGLGVARGGAPRARLAHYKVCWNGQCASADVLRALDQAIHDGVDVLSLSLGTAIPMFSDVDERDLIATGSFHAVANGIIVVCAAGNGGPSSQTVLNTAPWILTVAASTIDRSFPTSITLGNNKTIWGQAMFAGKEIGFTGLMYPESSGLIATAAGVCESLSLDNNSVVGKVVLCFTTVPIQVRPTDVSSVVKAAGGLGVIIAQNPRSNLAPCSDDFPCIVVDYELGTEILFYIRATSSPTVKLSLSRTLVGKPVSTKIAYFSSRGPSSIAPAILKPDIAAPGVSILAAVTPQYPIMDGGFSFGSGTSAATPHVSAVVALIKSLHPNWSPAAIKSAIITTAWQTDPSGEPIFAEGSPRKLADPFDYGGGLINPNRARNPGLVYDMGTDDYIHYLCAMGYNSSAISQLVDKSTVCLNPQPSILDVNLPSITIPNLRNATSLGRTVTNVGPTNSVYRLLIEPPLGVIIAVKPDTLVFNSTTKKVSFDVSVSTTHRVNAGYYFGSLTWTDGVHIVRSPISVRTQIIPSFTDD
ncbi:hypothetical protein RHMOL_Rhmol07G0090200 [Rhododendron molle]|uniref:Uncharacterized protein n=1 Tax=Rhododendron molle TaxID=49168 RepID=A0ACC0MYZ6_RHOML|nr:hypothetical protein RHMOL_Rhmol07G0090200 [Rhododendron molle]